MAVVQREKMIWHKIQSVLRYAQAFGKTCHTFRRRACNRHRGRDDESSDLLAINSKVSYIRYATAGKMMIKQQRLTSLLVKLRKDAPRAKTVFIMHRDDPSLYFSSEDDILLMIQIVNPSVSNPHKTALSSQISFMGRTGPDRLSWSSCLQFGPRRIEVSELCAVSWHKESANNNDFPPDYVLVHKYYVPFCLSHNDQI